MAYPPRTWVIVGAALIIVFAVSACGPPTEEDATEEPTEPSVLYAGVGADPTNLDPRRSTDTASWNITNIVYAGLFYIGDNLEIVPSVAREIEIPDDQTYIFHLHEGVLFHDGVELTAEDVKYTYDTFRCPDFGARNISFYEPIEEIIVHDPYKVEFRLSEPSAPIIYYLWRGIIPKHIAEEKGDEFFETNPVGAGPFVFKEWLANDRVVVEAFDDYFDGRPQIDQIVFRVLPEHTTKVVELETGGVHVVDSLLPEDVQRLQEDDRLEVTIRPGTGFDYFSFDHQNPPFDDRRVRQAFAYGLDRQTIVDHVYHGLREIAYSPIIPTSWGHNPNVTKFEYDPHKATELFADLGYADGFTADLKISEDATRREIAEIAQHQMQEFDISLEIVEQEWGAFYQDILDSDFDLYILGWGAQTDPDRGVYRQFHSSQWPPVGANRQRFANERVDELLDMARVTTDQDERQEYYFEIQEILAEEQSYVYLSYTVFLSAYSTELKNYPGRGGYMTWLPLKDAYLE